MKLFRLWLVRSLALYLVATAPIWLTACADDDDDAANDDDSTGDDDDDTSGTDDDDVTDDDDDVTGDDDDVTDDDDDLPACWTITTQPECEAREDCFAVVETRWWYFDATEEQCKTGDEPIYISCLLRDDGSPGLGCTVFELSSGITAVFFQPRSGDPLFPQCGIETNDPACACCNGGSDTGE